jgi:hypothetical protein
MTSSLDSLDKRLQLLEFSIGYLIPMSMFMCFLDGKGTIYTKDALVSGKHGGKNVSELNSCRERKFTVSFSF